MSRLGEILLNCGRRDWEQSLGFCVVYVWIGGKSDCSSSTVNSYTRISLFLSHSWYHGSTTILGIDGCVHLLFLTCWHTCSVLFACVVCLLMLFSLFLLRDLSQLRCQCQLMSLSTCSAPHIWNSSNSNNKQKQKEKQKRTPPPKTSKQTKNKTKQLTNNNSNNNSNTHTHTNACGGADDS